jgi:hypothetical protein
MTWKPFVEQDENCTCDVEKRQAIVNSVARRIAPWAVDENGNQLFYVDSFGWRGRIPGECESCYKRLIERLKKI